MILPKEWEKNVNGREIVVWGTGSYTPTTIVELHTTHAKDVSFFVARDWQKKPEFMEKKVFGHEVLDKKKHYVIISSIQYSNEIANDLRQMGFVENGDFAFLSMKVTNFNGCFEKLREPKQIWRGIAPTAVDRFVEQMKERGMTIKEYVLDNEIYSNYVENTNYEALLTDANLYRENTFEEKRLQHFVASELLQLSQGDIYIDIGSNRSPAPDIYAKLFGVKPYKQDMRYPYGLNGNIIGGDAADMPLISGFADKMALHCSFEHFEGDADIRFIKEAARVLKSGGKVCILPFYIADVYTIITDPVTAIRDSIEFEEGILLSCKEGSWERHARRYDVEHFMDRIYKHADRSLINIELYRILGAPRNISSKSWLDLALVVNRL